MQRWLAQRRVPYWPLGWLINRYLEHVIGARFDHIAPINTLAKASCRILLVHGLQDDIVPVLDARRIWQNCNATGATLLECCSMQQAFGEMGGHYTADIDVFETSNTYARSTTRASQARCVR